MSSAGDRAKGPSNTERFVIQPIPILLWSAVQLVTFLSFKVRVMLSLSCTTCRCLPAVEGHGSGPAVPGPPLTEVLDQVQDWRGVLCQGQPKEVVLHSSGGSGCE